MNMKDEDHDEYVQNGSLQEIKGAMDKEIYPLILAHRSPVARQINRHERFHTLYNIKMSPRTDFISPSLLLLLKPVPPPPSLLPNPPPRLR